MIVLEIILICLVWISWLVLSIWGCVIDILDVLDPEHKVE